MATVFPFPLAKRRDFVRRHADRIAGLPSRAAEAHLKAQLALQAKTMSRRRISSEIVDAEVRSLEAAIRAYAGHLIRAGHVG